MRRIVGGDLTVEPQALLRKPLLAVSTGIERRPFLYRDSFPFGVDGLNEKGEGAEGPPHALRACDLAGEFGADSANKVT